MSEVTAEPLPATSVHEKLDEAAREAVMLFVPAAPDTLLTVANKDRVCGVPAVST